MSTPQNTKRLITLDGSDGEGGGQILRTALTLALLQGQPFRIVKLRANREKPGLRPQHLSAVRAASELCGAEVRGDALGSRDLTFRPNAYEARDLSINIGTAGATALILQTLHLPIALKTTEGSRLSLRGGTFNTNAPSFPFLDETWRVHLAGLGAPIALAMPAAGFFPKGGGQLDAWIEPARLQPRSWTTRGPLLKLEGVAGVCNLPLAIAERMKAQAEARLRAEGFEVEIAIREWTGISQGAALHLKATYQQPAHSKGPAPASFLGLGERGKPAEQVALEGVNEFLAFQRVSDAAIDLHSADQLLLPLALAEGGSAFTVSEVTEHLRTNIRTIRAFLPDRQITIEKPGDDDQPALVVLA